MSEPEHELKKAQEEIALLKNTLAEHDEEVAVLKREALAFAKPLAEHAAHHLHAPHDHPVSIHAKHLHAARSFHERWKNHGASEE